MSNPIDREYAIGEIKRAHCVNCDNYNGIRCRSCSVNDAMNVVDSIISWRGVIDKNYWISTEKELPKEERLYAILSDNIISIAHYHEGKDGLWFYVDGKYEPKVDYWGFLPEFKEE